MPIKTCVFDAYGTVLDVAAAARIAAAEPEHAKLAAIWPQLAEIWRSKQLQYTWLRAITGDYTDFWQVTQDGLDFAMAALSLEGEAEMRERLLALYWELQAYEEVPEMLAKLKEEGFITAILSNGSPDMLNGAVRSAGLEQLLDDVLSVESVGIFKPSAKVYNLVGEKLGVAPSEVLFVSSNGWDAAGACGYGFQTVWVNRAGDPRDNLPAEPNFELDDLTLIPDLASR